MILNQMEKIVRVNIEDLDLADDLAQSLFRVCGFVIGFLTAAKRDYSFVSSQSIQFGRFEIPDQISKLDQ